MDVSEVLKQLTEEQRNVVSSYVESVRRAESEKSDKWETSGKKYMTALNRLKDALKKVGIESTAQEIDAQIAEYEAKVEELTKTQSSKADRVGILEKNVADLTATLESERKNRELATQKYTTSKMSEALNRAFADSIYGADIIVKDLIREGRVRMTDDEKIVFVDGDKTIDIDNGVKAFKASRPDVVKNPARPGSGSPPGGQPSGTQNTITRQQFDALSHPERTKFIKDGGKLTT